MESCKIDNKFLHCHSLFGGLDDCELDEIRHHFTERSYKPGENILTEGEPNNSLFFIINGDVSIIKENNDPDHPGAKSGNKVLLTRMHTGDTFGEMELIDIQPCAATVRADTETTVYTFTNLDLYQLSKWNQKTFSMIIMNLAREISRRLRATNTLLSYELYRRENGTA